MPEDIPEAPARLTDDEVAWRASDWSDFRRDYGATDEAIRKREYLAFCAGWDARHLSPTLTAAQQAAIDRVRHMIEASSHVQASITEALYTDAVERADEEALSRLTPDQRALVAEARRLLAERAQADEQAAVEAMAGVPEGSTDGAWAPPSHDHRPVQHRDGKPPWCPECGLTAQGTEPVSRFATRREARAAGHYVPPVVRATIPGRPIADNPQA